VITVESRTRLAVSGAAVFTASVAVVASVAITNAVAFADAPGAAIDADALSVPGAVRTAQPEPAPVATPEVTPAATAAPEPDATTKAVTVPAPKPVVVAPAAEVPTEAEQEEVVTEVAGSGSWDAAYKWAAEHGWSQERLDRWIALLTSKVAELESDSHYSGDKPGHRPPAPDSSGSPSAPVATTPGSG
jgi:outer membrane biosynthesis protein TonB